MDRRLARTNPRLYAARWLSEGEEGNGALLRALAPEELTLHVEALLTALVRPTALAATGRLMMDLRVEGSDVVAVSAFHQEDAGERKRYKLLEASGLNVPEARAVLDALWAANAKLGGAPACTRLHSVYFGGLWSAEDSIDPADEVAFQLRIYERLLGVLEALFSGLPLRRAELEAYEASYGGCIERPDGSYATDYGRPDEGYANLRLIWGTPDGGEAEGLCASPMSSELCEAVLVWAERVLRERGCPLWQRWQSPSAPSMKETPP